MVNLRKAAILEVPKTILDSGVLNMQHLDQSYSLPKGFDFLLEKLTLPKKP